MQAEQSDDGDERVAQGVLIDDDAFGKAFCAGGSDVVLAEFFEHGGADHSGEDGGEGAAHGDGGQDEMGDAAGSADRKPAEFDGDKQDEDGAEGEGGEGQAEQADEAEGAVLPAVAAESGGDSCGDGEQDCNEDGGDGELNGVGVAGEDEVSDRIVEAEGVAEVSVEDSSPVVDVLGVEGQVESVSVTQGDDVGRSGTFAQHLLDGVAGDEVNEDEDDGDNQPDYGNRVDEAEEQRANGAGNLEAGQSGSSAIAGWRGRVLRGFSCCFQMRHIQGYQSDLRIGAVV